MIYLPNGYLNTVSNFNFEKVKKSAFLGKKSAFLRSNFNYEKLVKSETLLYGFAEVGIKGVKYFGTSRNFACTPIYQMGIQIYDQIENSQK